VSWLYTFRHGRNYWPRNAGGGPMGAQNYGTNFFQWKFHRAIFVRTCAAMSKNRVGLFVVYC